MFSTSMMASSTTSPTAMASPPSVKVFRLMPKAHNTEIAPNSDSGMAVREIKAIRKLNRKRTRTTTTSPAPISKACVTLPTAASMKLACRNRAGW